MIRRLKGRVAERSVVWCPTKHRFKLQTLRAGVFDEGGHRTPDGQVRTTILWCFLAAVSDSVMQRNEAVWQTRHL